MNWEVIYRNADGDRCRISVTAEDRKSCFDKCRELSIQPISVEVASTSLNGTHGRHSRVAKTLVLFFGVVIAAFTIFLIVSKTEPKVPKAVSETPKVKREVTIARPPEKTVNVSIRTSITNTPSAVSQPRVSQGETNSYPSFLTKLKRNRVGHPAITNVRKKVTFKTGLEQTLNWVFNTPLGNPPPILPSISPEDSEKLVAILQARNEVTEEDDEQTADQKAMVEAAKKEMLEFLKSGGKPADFLTYYHGELKKAFNEHHDAQKMVIDSLRQDPEVGFALAEEVNKRFKEKGIKPVFIPPKYQRKD